MSVNNNDLKKVKKRKGMKFLSSVALIAGMTGAVAPAIALSNNAMVIHAGEEGDMEEICNGYIGGTGYSLSTSKYSLSVDIGTSKDAVIEQIRSFITIKSGKVTSSYASGDVCIHTLTNQTIVDSSLASITSSTWKDNTAGTYRFYVSYGGQSLTISAIVLDNYAPVTSGQASYITSPDKIVSLETILSNLKVIDNVDGDIPLSSSNVVSNEYHGGNETILGEHKIVISISDAAGNVATIDVYVIVADLSAPVFTGTPSTVDAYMSKNLSVESIKNLIQISDDIDTLTKDDVVVVEDNFTPNKNVPGTYSVKFKATDSAGNEAEHVISVVVKDDIKPIITGTDGYTKGSTDVQMTLDGMLNQLSVTDNVSTLEKSQLNIVSDAYSGNEGKVGTYKVVVNITDEAGNTSDNFTITIVILDDVAPVFWANNSFYVHVDGAVTLSNKQLAYIARSLGIVDNTKTANVQIISNEYEGNEKVKGEYVVSVLAVYDDGTQNTGSFTLSVDDDFNDVIVIPADEKPLKWYEKAWNGIKWFFSFKWLTTPAKFIWRKFIKPGVEVIVWLWNKLF